LHQRVLLRTMIVVPRLQSKSFDSPDEVRRFANGVMEIVTLDEIGVAHLGGRQSPLLSTLLSAVAFSPTV
jgi:hypothetical protein